ncbi:MAG: AMP-binding protein [Chloroflexi bacterium]|uniref:acetate--CoA ligase n=1 Tax=Candidatus Chlorohelix allophototropha TaxID=3003348 RepID=A0A8T7MAK3_9CHLR|nr:AMP-binding protein [Chloroflexota bacterium]WJW68999.1 AMP-binding protein [Chloroflexota bacterium L227-S17]
MFTEGAVVWTPTEEYTKGSHLEKLMLALGLDSYDALYEFSVEQPEQFWQKTLELLGIEWFEPYRQFVNLSKGKPFPDWFLGGKFNFTHNALRWAHKPESRERVALAWEGENEENRSLTYAELEREVMNFAAVLHSLGVQKGDRVGILMPMMPETVVAFLAGPAIGAIMVPMFSGFGTEAIVSRLSDSEAKILVTVDGFYRRGRQVQTHALLEEVTREYTGLEKIVIVRRLGLDVPIKEGRDLFWDDLMAQVVKPAQIEPMDSNDPYLIIYTSGTTGKPKGMIHTHTGFPLKSTQDVAQLFDLREGECLFWITDMGWMVGPLVIGAGLMLGATVVLYEGAPDFPNWGRLGNIIEKHKVTHFGGTPTLIRGMITHAEEVQFDRNSLRTLMSSGELWDPESFEWFFNVFGEGKRPIINYSGGTEISGGIVGNVIYRPIKVAGFNSALPGLKVAVLDDLGNPVRNQVGELAILEAFVGQTRSFWGEPQRYLETYWERFPDKWVHGDLCFHDSDGHFFILGRSDDTLKIAGKRLGPAEVEAIVAEHPAVAETAAVGVPHPQKGEELVVFVIPRPGIDEETLRNLPKTISNLIEERLGKAFRPGKVHTVKELPKTRNAKVMRRVIRRVYSGQNPGDLSALENPTAVEAIKRLV